MHVQLQPAYVLHHRPYRDSSRILELFTRDHGRVTVFARGARTGRKGSSLVSTLQPFHRLLVSWTGRGEAGQLTGAEFDGAVTALPSNRLVSGFYLNELLLKLFVRQDGHPDVFELYSHTLESMKRAESELPVLRVFEKRLLDALGYGLALERDAQSGEPLDPAAMYHYRLEYGPMRIAAEGLVENFAGAPFVFSGATLLALAREDLAALAESPDARRLLRAALDRVLDGRELKSREVMLALRATRQPS
jgi:DNA repair protein RecO (recombination protein O)